MNPNLGDWATRVDVYAEDIIAFGQEQWVVKQTGELISLELHQIDLLRLMFTRGGITEESCPALWNNLTDAGRARMLSTRPGQFPWKTMLWSEPKKSGKTEIGGLVGLWVTLSEPGVNEAFFIANDQEQSLGRAYARIVDHVNPNSPSYNPNIAAMVRTVIRQTAKPPAKLDFIVGDFVKAIPTDYAGEAGANPTISIWDELWAYTRENLTRLWEEFTIVPTRRNSVRFVTTYAGFRDESELLWTLYQRAVRHGVKLHKHLPLYESPSGDTVAWWSHEPRMPWQTKEYYEREKAQLRPAAYKRLHRNEWTRSESAFIDPALWESLPRTAAPPPASKDFPVYLGEDASHKRDSTAGVGVGWHPLGYPFLVRHKIWTPTHDEPVIPEDTLGPWTEDMVRDFDVRRIGCDPNHMETLIYRMQRDGLPVEEYLQNLDNLTRAGDALYTFIIQQRLLLYPAADLDDHVMAATAKETPRGWKLSKELAHRHIDAAVALSIALALARQHGPHDVDEAPLLSFLGATKPDAPGEAWVGGNPYRD